MYPSFCHFTIPEINIASNIWKRNFHSSERQIANKEAILDPVRIPPIFLRNFMKFPLLFSFSNLSLPGCPTVYDIFIFSLQRYLVKLITGFSLASPACTYFRLQILKKRSQVWRAGYQNAQIITQEYSALSA